MNNKLDGAQVTEAHRKLAADLCRNATGSNRALHHVPKFAQLIAESEARAVESALHDRASGCGVCRGEIGMVCVHLSSVKTDSDNLARKAEALRLQATEAERDQLRADVDRILREKGVVVQHGVECLRRAIRAEAKLKSLVDSF